MSANDGGASGVERGASGAESTQDARGTRVRVRTRGGHVIVVTFDPRPAGPSAVRVPSIDMPISPPL